MPFIRTMLRWTRRVLLTLSVVLCLAFCVLWVRGYFVAERAAVVFHSGGIQLTGVHVLNDRGWTAILPFQGIFAVGFGGDHFLYDREKLPWAKADVLWMAGISQRLRDEVGDSYEPPRQAELILPTGLHAAIFAVPPVLWLLWWWKRRPLNRRGFPVVISPAVPTNGEGRDTSDVPVEKF